MENEEKINLLSSKLDKYLQGILYESDNYLPTITSTFECIENSSISFKTLLRSSFSLEHGVKKEIGKAIKFHYSLEEPIKPPYTNYFKYILVSLITNTTDEEDWN